MEISVNKQEVYKYVIALTARAGKSAGSYPDIAATEDNEAVLDLYLSAAVNEAEGELRRKLKKSNDVDMVYSGDTVTVNLNDYARMDDGVMGMIRTSMRLYAAHYLTAAWLETTVAKDLSETYRTSAAGFLAKMEQALNQRDAAVVSEADYSSRSDADYELSPTTGGAADYEERQGDTEISTDGSGAADYEERQGDTEISTDGSGAADYEERQGDTEISTDGSGAADYEERQGDTEISTDGSGAADYEERQGDILYTRKLYDPEFYDNCKFNPLIPPFYERD